VKIGYTLSTEEQEPKELIATAVLAEEKRFDFLGVSDHFHPWTPTQGQSPFSWSVIAAVGQATSSIKVLSEVVCPIMRYHPAIVAQAAATSQLFLDGRYLLGVGTGEYLNEHVVGEGWPHIDVRRLMLEEAIDIIRELWTGEKVNHYGDFFTVEAARLYTVPDTPPPIIVSAFGPKSAAMAGRKGDGLVSVAPEHSIVEAYEKTAGAAGPRYAQMTVCFGSDKEAARQQVKKQWPNAGLSGQAVTELRTPEYFQQAFSNLTVDQATNGVVCGDSVDEYLQQMQKFADAGYTHVYLHDVSGHKDAFIDFAAKELLPKLQD
jgi:G6PDH family F420-dependent oxidoreductase